MTADGVAATVSVGAMVTVGPTLGFVVPVELGAAHDELLMVSWIIVTAPLRASARPSRVTPLLSEIEVSAMMVPLKLVVVPSVAELPTFQ